jgi:hypothetical protein
MVLNPGSSSNRSILQEFATSCNSDALASTEHNLGYALLRLGERDRQLSKVEDAVAALRSALMERTRERVPLEWAATQNNLGAALEVLGGREREGHHCLRRLPQHTETPFQRGRGS